MKQNRKPGRECAHFCQNRPDGAALIFSRPTVSLGTLTNDFFFSIFLGFDYLLLQFDEYHQKNIEISLEGTAIFRRIHYQEYISVLMFERLISSQRKIRSYGLHCITVAKTRCDVISYYVSDLDVPCCSNCPCISKLMINCVSWVLISGL